jgi:hypothetical protein
VPTGKPEGMTSHVVQDRRLPSLVAPVLGEPRNGASSHWISVSELPQRRPRSPASRSAGTYPVEAATSLSGGCGLRQPANRQAKRFPLGDDSLPHHRAVLPTLRRTEGQLRIPMGMAQRPTRTYSSPTSGEPMVRAAFVRAGSASCPRGPAPSHGKPRADPDPKGTGTASCSPKRALCLRRTGTQRRSSMWELGAPSERVQGSKPSNTGVQQAGAGATAGKAAPLSGEPVRGVLLPGPLALHSPEQCRRRRWFTFASELAAAIHPERHHSHRQAGSRGCARGPPTPFGCWSISSVDSTSHRPHGRPASRTKRGTSSHLRHGKPAEAALLTPYSVPGHIRAASKLTASMARASLANSSKLENVRASRGTAPRFEVRRDLLLGWLHTRRRTGMTNLPGRV